MNRYFKPILIMLLALVCQWLSARDMVQSLNGQWQFRQAGKMEWMPATVPGCVHTDLMASGVIPDPYYSDNEKKVQWVGEKDWEYVREFDVDSVMLSYGNVELCMEGIDTYADVYVNDMLLVSCDNMFRTWTPDVKHFLKEGRNKIRVVFHSVFKVDMPKYLASDFKLMAWPNNDQSDIWLSLYARKAGYNYGWDWGPRLITSGIWKDISLKAWDDVRIESVHIKTLSLEGNKKVSARMQAVCDIKADSDKETVLTVSSDNVTKSSAFSLKKGDNRVVLDFVMKNPELWWSAGAGEPHLYDFDIKAETEGGADSASVKAGVRTIEIVRESDDKGQSMYVRLNGRPVFIKGANYIPTDNFPNRTTEEGYDKVIKSALEANMNMLRIWGGGIYENDIFYELCDRYGILVWQDMMFACGMFPADEHYLYSVSCEVRDNVRRLRNHPCIALWNGNNENEISYFGWGWRDRLTEEADRIYQSNLKKLFHEVIPQAIYEEDDTRYYHPTSPNTGYNGISSAYGDVHFWSVWKGGWIEEYNYPENIGRFMSEYGFQSYPQKSTMDSVIPENQRYLGSNAMLSHQRARHDETRDPNFGDNMMKMYMSKYFTVPSDLEEFIYVSQIMQAEAVKTAIEAHRRAKPFCMGTLFWQINDCWPVASWSSVDYYGNWKALQYYAKRLYKEILVSAYADSDESISFKVVSDRAGKFSGNLSVMVMTLDGKTVYDNKVPFVLDADAAADVLKADTSVLYGGLAADEVVVVMKVYEGEGLVSENVFYPVYSNKYDYPAAEIKCEVTESEDGLLLAVSSDVYARDVWFYVDGEEVFFDDNAVNLIPGEPRYIKVDTELSAGDFMRGLKWMSINGVR